MPRKPTPIVRDAEALYRRGIEELEYERIDQAVGLLRQAADLAPDSAEVLLALGIALMRALEMNEAGAALEKAIELAPDNFYAHFRLGELYMRLGLPSKAKEELDRAMALSATGDQRKMIRSLLSIEAGRAARRVWRPDFGSLLRGKKDKK